MSSVLTPLRLAAAPPAPELPARCSSPRARTPIDMDISMRCAFLLKPIEKYQIMKPLLDEQIQVSFIYMGDLIFYFFICKILRANK
jgi:hypothetical protein